MGQVSRDDIFGVLEDETRFAASPFSGVPLSRRSMLTEAYFYEALLAQSNGDAEAMRADLERVVQLDRRAYTEHGMAKFLLHRWTKAGTTSPGAQTVAERHPHP